VNQQWWILKKPPQFRKLLSFLSAQSKHRSQLFHGWPWPETDTSVLAIAAVRLFADKILTFAV